ncbi:phenylacetate-CoA oxygenase subunit PaaC [Ktedonobacteria bacterium brp13]|nr:phenylacetate-CoA oxygenase subunit PaaC [Ktedonobacteria bacterium brp13]
MNEIAMIATPQAIPPTLRQPLARLLLSLADDEFILGYWDSEWTGVAPILEEDVACSSIAQDEIGHARLFYEEAAAIIGITADQLAYGRQPAEYRQAQLVERNRGNWAFTIARQYLYDTADNVRLKSLKDSTYLPLAQDVSKIQREEVYHLMHTATWLDRLANIHGTSNTTDNTTNDTAHTLLTEALDSLWPDAIGLFEPFEDEELLLEAGILSRSSKQLEQEWLESIEAIFDREHLPFPFIEVAPGSGTIQQAVSYVYQPTIQPRYGGRQGLHVQDFMELWEQMTMVYRLDPQAQW